MRVLQIGATFVGAQEKIEFAVHKRLLAEGQESCILFAIGSSRDERVIRYENNVDSFVRRLFRKLLGKKPSYAALSTTKLIHRIKKYKPDLIHLHILHHGYLDYIRLLDFLGEYGVPVVFTLHDMWAFTGGCYYYTKESCDGYLSGCVDCPASIERLDNPAHLTEHYHRRKQELFSNIDSLTFVAVSSWVASEAGKSFLSKYDVRVIENGIDVVDIPVDASVKEYDGVFNILCVATNWDERKGIYRIFDTARLLGDSYRFNLVGVASEDIISQAPANVTFLGYLRDKSALTRLYSEADLHLSASLEETFGMTFIEAAFSGTRSIGYACTAITETLLGVSGIAVDEYTPEALSKAIKECAQSDSVKLSDSEKKSVADRYSSEAMAEKYCSLYREILQNTGNVNEK